jgi:hypothetical protein
MSIFNQITAATVAVFLTKTAKFPYLPAKNPAVSPQAPAKSYHNPSLGRTQRMFFQIARGWHQLEYLSERVETP